MMTDEQDGKPPRRPTDGIDGPTVMGPSAGHLHGPVPGEPTLPAPSAGKPTTRPDGPAPQEAPAGSTREGGPPPAPQDEATPADLPPVPPPTTRRDDTTATGNTPQDAAIPDSPAPPPAWQGSPSSAPQDEATLAEPTSGAPTPAAPSATRPSTPRDDTTLPEPGGAVAHRSASEGSPSPATRPSGSPSAPLDDPTLAEPARAVPGDPTPPSDRPDGPPAATQHDDPTLVTTPAPWPDGPTVVTPVDDATLLLPDGTAPPNPDGPTMAVVDESPTTTGPTVGGWPLDELLPAPPADLVWRPDTPQPAARRPAYYVGLGAAVVLVVALIATAVLVTVMRPTREVAGTATGTQTVPDITAPSTEPPPTTPPQPQAGPAEHPLSASAARMGDATCALPRFDLADDRQAAFYTAAKTCADDAWRDVLDEAGLAAAVEVVTVTGPVRTSSCGEITPASPSAQCDGTVYMTPAHLRDTERNGRYPGRYFGVFLREYARALQFTTGLAELAAAVDDADARLAQQATCMAGIASGAMAGRGAVDANITGEIGDRLTAVDAPPDAKAMLDRGSRERTLKACNTW